MTSRRRLLNEAIAKIQPAVKKQEWPDFLRSLELFTNGKDIQVNVLETNRPVAARFFTWLKEMVPAIAAGDIVYEAAGERFRISGGSFFQTNRFLMDALVNEVIGDEKRRRSGGSIRRSRFVHTANGKTISTCAGGGTRRHGAFTIWSSTPKRPVYRISRPSARQPKSFYAGCRRRPLGWWPIRRAPVWARKPRLSCCGSSPQRLTIVSCDPATLARDLKVVLGGGYRISRMSLVDLFPQTYHFETVVRLMR